MATSNGRMQKAKPSTWQPRCRQRFLILLSPLGILLLTFCFSSSCAVLPATAQEPLQQNPPIPPPVQQVPQQPTQPPAIPPVAPPLQPPPPSIEQPTPGPPPSDIVEITFEPGSIGPNGDIEGSNVRITVGEYTLTGGRAAGNLNRDVVFSSGATLTYRGQTINGDTIRFSPKTKAFRVENIHTALTPEFLHGQLLSPLYLSGADIHGTRGGPISGQDIDATTCDRPNPDYLIRAQGIEVDPGKRVVLKHALFMLWGHRLITLPTLIIPLDRRERRDIGYTPRVGRSVDEGFYVKSALNYLLADRVPGILHLDLMEKKGLGTGIQQAWNLAKIAGAMALYAIPTGGTNKNLSGNLNNRFLLGGGQTLTLDGSYQKNSYLSLPETTNLSTRLGFNRNVAGFDTTLNLARTSTDSAGFSTRSLTANLAQTASVGRSLRMSFNSDFSEYSTGSASGTSQRTDQLAARFQADQSASNYALQLVTNGNIAVGGGTGQSFFGGVERLPELSLNNYRFTHGFLSRIPANFMLSVGRYSEGGSLVQSGPSNISTERALTGFDVNNLHYALTGKTDLNMSGGFQQYFYGDGSAQYVIRNTTELTQRFWKRSGVHFDYTYQRPEGGTPFRFDQQGQYHSITADAGWLDDRRMQLTARVGYDLAQTQFPGSPATPWQTLSINMLNRPVDWLRLQNLFSFDPNTGKFLNITSDLRIRGRRDFAFDLVTRYDPQRHKLGNANTYLNLPIGRDWRVLAILQYNGYLSRFESQSFQIIKDLHCLEAAITYVNNPFGFRTDRQIFFQLRIKAIPIFQGFGVGQFGQALDTGVGHVF